MELYTRVAYQSSRALTLAYSSSFGISSRFFEKDIQPHIYAVYGLVRIADEIVDTYKGPDAGAQLDQLESDTFAAITSQYSANPIIHAFALTAKKYHIDAAIIEPFFASMRMDLSPQSYTGDLYQTYIHGSAEVVGLICLRVFCRGDQATYAELEPGACALGAAYQKVNFLRDLASDYKELGRLYFPDETFEAFDEDAKQRVITDITSDFALAKQSLVALPDSSQLAVKMSYVYYTELLRVLETTPVEIIKSKRVRVATPRKLWLLVRTVVQSKVGIR